MWIERQINDLALARAKTRPVVVITGARQCGKTSLVRRLFPKHHFVSLDLPSEAELAERNPKEFFERHPPPVVIDEVQYAPQLFRHLKSLVDAHRNRNGQFILTGSQAFELMQHAADSLAGRVEILRQEGLSWSEIRAANKISNIEDVIYRGGYPELHASPDIDVTGFYRSYVTTYLERDLRHMLQVSSLRDYERFLRLCALRTGQIVNKAELARDTGISPSTAGQWLSLLETSGIIAFLEPWFSNRTKSLVKSPKLYFCDTGLCCFLMGVTSAGQIKDSPFTGALWETFVFSEIRRTMQNRQGGWDLHFWRDRTKEVDFLRNRAGFFDLIEAKWTEHPDARDANPIQLVARELKPELVNRRTILCRCAHEFPIADGVNAAPIESIQHLMD